MNILLISPYNREKVGGISTWTKTVLDFFTDSKNISVILLNTSSRFKNLAIQNSIYLFFLGILESILVLTKFFFYIISYKKKIDMIHLCSSGSNALFKDQIITFIAKKNNIPIVVHFHFGLINQIFEHAGIHLRLIKKIYSYCNYFIVLDEISYKTLLNNSYNRCIKIPNPLSISSSSFDIKTVKKKIAIFVGHIIKTKGVFEVVTAFSIYKKIPLYLIGPVEKKIKKELQEIAKKNKFEDIVFTGSLYEKELISYYAKARYFILASYTEGFPYSVLEAMFFKCTILATNVGAIPEMLSFYEEEKCGAELKMKDTNSIVSTLIDCENQDKEKYVDNAFKKVSQNFTSKVVCPQYSNLWKSILLQTKK